VTRPIRRGWGRLDDGVRDRVDAARANPRVAIGWAAAAILVIAWIGWAIYTTAEYGGAAGLGVLISWPAAVAALALIAAPFVGLWLLVKRLRPNGGGPPIAGGAPDSGGDEQFTGGTYPG